MEHRGVIGAFVTYLRAQGHPMLAVDRWPDDENRSTPDIDAIAGPFAIEHTSIDTLPDQRQKTDWFLQAAGGLEDEIVSLPFRLNIILKFGAVAPRQNWRAVREALKSWIITQSAALPEGAQLVSGIPGVPFEMTVRKALLRSPGLFFSRQIPRDSGLSDRIKNLLDRKAQKLERYQLGGRTTVLLVESEDIALMNDSKMLEAMRSAYPNGLPNGVDLLWYADTSLPSDIEFFNFTAEFKC
jgi:hypothetical protein